MLTIPWKNFLSEQSNSLIIYFYDFFVMENKPQQFNCVYFLISLFFFRIGSTISPANIYLAIIDMLYYCFGGRESTREV